MYLEKFKPKNKRKIVMKDGNNKSLILGVLAIAIFLTMMFTSKHWLGDDRDRLTRNTDVLYFAMKDVNVNSYKVDIEHHVGEINITETLKSQKKKYDLSFIVYDDKENKLPFNVIDGVYTKENEESIIEKRNRIVQFGVPEDYYYIKIIIEQKDQTTQEIILDYRDVKNGTVLEKGKDYLVELDALKEEQSTIDNYLQDIKANITILEKEKKELQKSDAKEKDKHKTRIIEINTQLEEYNLEVKEIKKELDIINHKIKAME